ncbi:MAG: protein,cyclic nucleotide-binding protein,cache protein [Gammaproteobacteria bacterium]|nr:protein,cyclic nucleotide-binding protein,cache protein [Gammaproteobacteria bacterium]
MKEQLNDPKILRNIPIFKTLTEMQLEHILKAPENRIEEYAPKKMIIREAEIGDCMYIILEGTAEVSIRGGSGNREISIATLRAGDFFGEQSILPEGSGRRNATVKAFHQIKVFRIDKKYVLLSVKRDDTVDESEEPTEINYLKLEPDEVRDTIRKLRLFKSLSYNELATIRNWTEVITVGPGDFVLKESQPGEHMYVILDGMVEVFTLDNDGKIVILATLKSGDYFGEQALMPDSKGKRSAFARTDNASRLIKIPKEYFTLVLNRDSELAKELKKVHEAQKQKLKNIQQS